MSHAPAQQPNLRHEMVYALVDAAPEGWLRMDLVCRATVDAHVFTLTVLTAEGHAPMDVPEAVTQLVPRLRSEYYKTGVGTWFSLRFIVDPPTRFRIVHNLDWDPEWQPALDAGAWMRDLAAFPRDTAHIPPWLGDRLGRPTAGSPSGPLDEHRLWVEIANRLALSVPTDWARVTLTYRVIGDHRELAVLIHRLTDGAAHSWQPPQGIAERLTRLRAGMYRPGRGTWFQVVAHLQGDLGIEFEYTWDDQPDWDVQPPVSAFVNELATFPRDARRAPDWWTRRLGPVAVATLGGTADVATALRSVEDAAAELELDPKRYRVGEVADGAWCLVPGDGRWTVFLAQDAERLAQVFFDTVHEAARYFTGHLYLNRAAFRDELPPDAKRPTDEWPIQPLGGDVGLQLYGGKRIVTLPPGTEMDRYGGPSGNTLYAARTEFTHRSHPAEAQRLEYHVYRLRRPVRAIVGSPIPWYDQAGGGTAYVLERSVADLLADESIEEIAQATTRSGPDRVHELP